MRINFFKGLANARSWPVIDADQGTFPAGTALRQQSKRARAP